MNRYDKEIVNILTGNKQPLEDPPEDSKYSELRKCCDVPDLQEGWNHKFYSGENRYIECRNCKTFQAGDDIQQAMRNWDISFLKMKPILNKNEEEIPCMELISG